MHALSFTRCCWRSFFSYNITRQYPFRWFTWVVIIGGIITVILVSVLNVAITGYELRSFSTTDPNSTLSSDRLGKVPSLLTRSNAACQLATIPLQTRIYTNNTAFPYLLRSVYKLTGDGQRNMTGSLIYNNQPLQNCNISGESISASTRTIDWQVRWRLYPLALWLLRL